MSHLQRGRRQWPTDDSNPIINPDTELIPSHLSKINETSIGGKELRTRQDYCRRINHLILWWQEHYPSYYEVGTRVIPQEELENEMLFYYPKQRNYIGRDIIYRGLNVDLVLAYLGSTKCKDNGKIYSQVDRRK